MREYTNAHHEFIACVIRIKALAAEIDSLPVGTPAGERLALERNWRNWIKKAMYHYNIARIGYISYHYLKKIAADRKNLLVTVSANH